MDDADNVRDAHVYITKGMLRIKILDKIKWKIDQHVKNIQKVESQRCWKIRKNEYLL